MDDLVPGYIEKLPVDIFNKPHTFQYRKENKNYIIYSFGPDTKDDKGHIFNDIWFSVGVKAKTGFTLPPSP